ncbi:MAG: AbrB/MazE/SpoVT family DNA-binding domain-containing protein [Planctomycetes bacterium]|nr:AbrB/MazE/SpoVT family DNA-binding domain-containing protein [Planctomycetota bacterium]
MAGGLIRAFTNVDEKGRIFIPDNIRRNVGIEPGQLVEMQIVGSSNDRQTMKLVIHQYQKTNRG